MSEASETIQRKLTTIFYADVVGFSRLMERDEEATLQTLRRYRGALTGFVERHHGRVANTAGDSVLAEFASVVEAVQCAIEVQRELGSRNAEVKSEQRMEFRIGVNLGDVMVEGDDLYGEGVNVAARLQALAEPGGICISGTVYDQVHNKLRLGFDFIGEQTVKNIVEPVPVYKLCLDGSKPRVARHERGHGGRSHGDGAVHVPAARLPSNAEVTWVRRVYLLFLASVFFGFIAIVSGIALHEDIEGEGGKIDGDVTFSEDTRFAGKIDGDVLVTSGVQVLIAGKVDGDITIEPGASVMVRGKVDGDVINRGGLFRIRGSLGGSEHYEPAPGAPTDRAAAETRMQEMMAAMDDGPTWRDIVPGTFLFLTVAAGLAGVIMAYVHRGDGGAWTDSHYTFQIRSFWIGLLAMLVGGALTFLFVGVILLMLLPFWLLIRCGRGLNRVNAQQPQPYPRSWAFG